MSDADAVRKQVEDSYTRALEATRQQAGAGCCAPSGCCQPAGAAAQTAGYDQTDVAAVPDGAVASSFGCGNPVAFAGIRPGDTVLDLGSGAGLDLLLAARNAGPTGRVIGVDMTDAMISAAREHIEQAGLADRVEVRKGLIEAMPVADGEVDVVISNCVINLSPDKPAVFKEIARVLASGGRFSISDIVVDELPDWARVSQLLHHSCVAGAIAEADYLAGLEAAGLADVRVTDRHVYDAASLAAIIHSDLPELVQTLETELGRPFAEIAGALAGRVWSARFEGTRP